MESLKPESVRMEAMYEEYSGRIYRFCHRLSGNRHDAEDLTQEVFVAAFQGWGRFVGRSSLSTWLYKIAVYRWRAKRELRHRSDVSLDWAPIERLTASDQTGLHDDYIALESALKVLSSDQREAFLLVKAEGLSCKEAARALSIPVGTLKYRVHEAVCRLRTELDPLLRRDSHDL